MNMPFVQCLSAFPLRGKYFFLTSIQLDSSISPLIEPGTRACQYFADPGNRQCACYLPKDRNSARSVRALKCGARFEEGFSSVSCIAFFVCGLTAAIVATFASLVFIASTRPFAFLPRGIASPLGLRFAPICGNRQPFRLAVTFLKPERCGRAWIAALISFQLLQLRFGPGFSPHFSLFAVGLYPQIPRPGKPPP